MHLPTRGTAGRLLAVAVASSFFAIAAASPAAAHDGTAVITSESQTIKGTSVDYVVRAVWDNDGHAADATATVVAESPSGDRVGPVPMEPTDDDGRYTATVDFPSAGDWNVRFTVVTPPGTLEITQTIPAVAGGAPEAVPTPTPESTSTSVAVTADAAASTVVDGAERAAASQNRERPTSTAGAALFFFIVAAIILGGCVLAYRSRGRRQAQRPTRKPQSTATATTTAAAAAPEADPGTDEAAEPAEKSTDTAGSEPGATDDTAMTAADAASSADTKDITAE
jgi:hypothetical protein